MVILDKPSLFLLALYYALISWPLVFFFTTPQDIEIDQRIVNALITASGILFGLITAIAVSKLERPPFLFFIIVVWDFFLLLFAGTALFYVALGYGSLLFTLSLTMASFMGSHFTALSLLILHWFKR